MNRPFTPIAGGRLSARRQWLVRFAATVTAALAIGGCTQAPTLSGADGPRQIQGSGRGADRPPIVFVHGNGDSAAAWMTTLWRFESAGWPADRLFALDQPLPLARDDDRVAQPSRSSAAEHMHWLKAEVERILRHTGAPRVVLLGNSRGGLVIRNYVRNGGGATRVSHAVLGGAPNHGVWATDFNLGSEFNGRGPFLTALNASQGPDGAEVTPGVQWLTLRSDANDKYAQPDGRWIGQPKMATGVDAASPELRGALNRVLPGVDHRETSFSPQAFAATWQFLTGHEPPRTRIVTESIVRLDGNVFAWEGATPVNIGVAGARVEVWRVSADTGERLDAAPMMSRITGADGRWGPLHTDARTALEFVVTAADHPVTHVYRSPFPRSSAHVHLRPARALPADAHSGSPITMTRPRGYFDLQRQRVTLDGRAPPGVPPGVAGVSSARLVLSAAEPRAVEAVLNDERIVMRSRPASEGRVVVAEFHH